MEEFEKRYNGLEIEPQMQQLWEQQQVYKYVPDQSRPIYSIDTPPPPSTAACTSATSSAIRRRR